MDVNEELKFLRKFKIFFFFFAGGGGGVGGEGSGSGLGGQGGCERRIEVFAKNSKKKKLGGGIGLEGVRVDVKVELKFL